MITSAAPQSYRMLVFGPAPVASLTFTDSPVAGGLSMVNLDERARANMDVALEGGAASYRMAAITI